MENFDFKKISTAFSLVEGHILVDRTVLQQCLNSSEYRVVSSALLGPYDTVLSSIDFSVSSANARLLLYFAGHDNVSIVEIYFRGAQFGRPRLIEVMSLVSNTKSITIEGV